MSGQQFKNAGGASDDGFDGVEAGGQTQAQTSTSDINSMLDEIDGVLESNATEFVSGFVQKGGQ